MKRWLIILVVLLSVSVSLNAWQFIRASRKPIWEYRTGGPYGIRSVLFNPQTAELYFLEGGRWAKQAGTPQPDVFDQVIADQQAKRPGRFEAVPVDEQRRQTGLPTALDEAVSAGPSNQWAK